MLPIRDLNPRSGPAPVTWALLGATVVAFLVQVGVLGQNVASTLNRAGAFIPDAFFPDPASGLLSLLLHAFLHADPLHLIGNLFFLAVFGDNVEERLGSGRFLLFYLAAAAAAALVHGLVQPGSRQPMVGASGAVSAVLGAYILWFPTRKVQAFVVPLFLPWLIARLVMRIPRFHLWWLPAWLYIGYWALIQLVEASGTLAVGPVSGAGVAWWAHVGGFGFGLVAGPILMRTRS